ncbi:uncharacterized protein DUF1203 [Roseibium hamelinense]|uniref:Uncharacterized protein DUF1203 n=1 Tax=Roseibium hamelinense TaxID=150831 RepID=A0A562SP22_9HYPH|nr:DUF1203 domain-containing protein [Roseibium hamelinense]MTI44321.1 DUF1203 domain-containing protein [Roseibium hamelinense]TWI82903.1 uncharacterized protein DUF1203 [Roseibium hamelinense]
MFQIHALPAERFEELRTLSEQELRARNIQVHISDGTYPCRVSLSDAPEGEQVFLLNFEHQSAASPYRSRHAIYVRALAETAQVKQGEIPVFLTKRLLSVRGFDRAGNMVDADVVDGRQVADLVERMFDQPAVDEIHLHFARPGCFAARVTRGVHQAA